MNKKLLAIACSWGALLLSSCMDTSVMESDISGIPPIGIAHYDGTIYDYLQNGDPLLGVTYDSLLYLLDYSDENSSVPLKFADLKTCLQDEEKQYTFIAAPDSCFRFALKSLNNFRRLNKLTITEENISADATEAEKNAIGDMTLKKLLNYRKEIERTDDKKPAEEWTTDIYEYKAPLDSMLCRYMTQGLYDTEMLSRVSSAEGQIIQGLYSYRMNLMYKRLPASGFVGNGPKDITFYDMRNTLEKTRWESTKVLWTDVYTTNGVIHVLVPQHEFGFGNFIHYFRNIGHEE